MLTLSFLGGAGTVTGSKHLLTFGQTRLLIDCGLFQGLKNLRELNWEPLSVDPRTIDAVILTHAHLDHSGYLPKLVRDGFTGSIFSTPATRAVAELILKDSAHLQEKDADYANRKGYSKHHPALPLYGVRDAERALKAFVPVLPHKSTSLPGETTLLLRGAGHILGASTAQIDVEGQRIVFSGDLGRYGDPLMKDPESVPDADYVVIESTYGNRQHEAADPVEALGVVVERTVKRGGTVVIPAFAVGRAQSLIYHLWQLKQSARLPNIPVYLDSPMAGNASQLLNDYPNDHKLKSSDYEAACGAVIYVRDVEESKKLSANRFPKVIISASGMATGGRVLHHIAAFGPDYRNTVLFSGYQAAGTRGRTLLEGAREVKMHGQWVPIRAEIAELPMLSAHADSNELLRWLKGFKRPPRRLFIVHGETDAADSLRMRIEREMGWHAVVPRQDQVFTL